MTGSRPGACLVIGTGPKLGLSVARRFGRGGHAVAIVARKADALEDMRKTLAADGSECVAIAADMSAEGEAARVVKATQSSLGPVEVLVYNAAALGVRGLPSEIDLDLLNETLRVNLLSALTATQAAIPDMRKLGRGTVVFTNGTWGLTPSAPFCAIGLAKAALRNLALSFAEELAPDNVHVASFMISGVIKAGTEFDPDLLAEKYWALHEQPSQSWEHDILY